jgi:beta-glucanase (GH16 family)
MTTKMMISKKILLLSLLLLRGVTWGQGTIRPTLNQAKNLISSSYSIEKTGYAYVWGDEFNADSISPQKWWAQTHPRENSLFSYQARRENIFAKDGNMVIRAIKDGPDTLPYTSGMVFSSKAFGHGHFVEIRCKIPKGKGFFPAFWFWAATKKYQEVDVFEFWCDNVTRFSISNHYGRDTIERLTHFRWVAPLDEKGRAIDMSLDFHTYGVEWDDKAMSFYLDGQRILTFDTYLPPEPFPLILNLAINDERRRSPTRRTVFPADFLIDYVRVYKKKG